MLTDCLADVTTYLLTEALLDRLRRHVLAWFGVGTWTDVSAEEHRERVARAQDVLNKDRMAHIIAAHLPLAELLQTEQVMVQSNLYFRAARPQKEAQESVGWHRESFYGCPREALNVWVPIANVTPENSIRYIPGSADIPEEQIELSEDDPCGVERASPGHKIGLLYAPKRIVGGVDLDSAQPLIVPEGHAAVFSSLLIHGAAQNRTPRIRFSVDFRVIAREHVGKQKQHFASGREMFEALA